LDSSIVQGPFSVAPCQTLISRFAAFASLYPTAARCAWAGRPASHTGSPRRPPPRAPVAGERVSAEQGQARYASNCGTGGGLKASGAFPPPVKATRSTHSLSLTHAPAGVGTAHGLLWWVTSPASTRRAVSPAVRPMWLTAPVDAPRPPAWPRSTRGVRPPRPRRLHATRRGLFREAAMLAPPATAWGISEPTQTRRRKPSPTWLHSPPTWLCVGLRNGATRESGISICCASPSSPLRGRHTPDALKLLSPSWLTAKDCKLARLRVVSLPRTHTRQLSRTAGAAIAR
jgi:hypothetical protein